MTQVTIKIPVKDLTISDEGMQFIREKEAGKYNIKHYNPATEEFEAYLDDAGVPTIGYGHTKDVKMEDKMTKGQAEQLFKEEIQTHCAGIYKHITADITQNQFDALASLTYNSGPNFFAWEKNQPKISMKEKMSKQHKNSWIQIRQQQGQKEYNRGLQMRRYEESVRFLRDHNQSDPKIKQFVNETKQKRDQLEKEIQDDKKGKSKQEPSETINIDTQKKEDDKEKERFKGQSDSEQDAQKEMIYSSGDPYLIEFYEQNQKRQSNIKQASQILGRFAGMGPGMIL